LADTRGEIRTYTGDQPVGMAAKNVKDKIIYNPRRSL
jgi:hypothetical protein